MKKKLFKKLSFLLMFLMLCILSNNVFPNDWQMKTYTYISPFHNYEIEFPMLWLIRDSINTLTFQASYIGKSLKEGGISPAYVSVAVRDKKFRLKETLDSLRQIKQLIEEGEDTINGKKATYLVYIKKFTNEKCKAYEITTNAAYYWLSYSAENEYFDEYLPEAEKIIKSIKIDLEI